MYRKHWAKAIAICSMKLCSLRIDVLLLQFIACYCLLLVSVCEQLFSLHVRC